MSKINLSQTQVFPKNSLENAVQAGSLDGEGIYFSLLKWYPGYMSAPHYYATDRLCVVVSGVWWVNSGNDFDPANCVPTPVGSYIRRVAGTPHYDGVIASGTEPAMIAISGIAPVNAKLVDPQQPGWRGREFSAVTEISDKRRKRRRSFVSYGLRANCQGIRKWLNFRSSKHNLL